jgi:hypothetical protein
MALSEKADPKFFWNHYLCEKMMNGDYQEGNNNNVSAVSSALNSDVFLRSSQSRRATLFYQ